MQLIPETKRVPLWLKLSFTAFMAILIPVYWWCYGPTNFLYFCDALKNGQSLIILLLACVQKIACIPFFVFKKL